MTTNNGSNGYGKIHYSNHDHDDDDDDKHYDVNAAVQGLISDLEGSAAMEQERVMMTNPGAGGAGDAQGNNGYVDNHNQDYLDPYSKPFIEPEYTSNVHDNVTIPTYSLDRGLSTHDDNIRQEEVEFIEEPSTFSERRGHFADEEDVLLNEISGRQPPSRSRYQRNYFCYRLCSWHTSLCIGSFLLLIGAVATIKRLNEPRTTPSESNSFSVPAPPAGLEVVCSHNYIRDLNNGDEECREACAPGSCCFEDEFSSQSEGGCFTENYKICTQYSVCLLLGTFVNNSSDNNANPPNQKGHTVVNMPSSNLAASCNAMAISTQEGLDHCKSSCEPSRCCFVQKKSESCYSYKDNFESCDAFRSHCSVLGVHFGGEGQGPVVPPEDNSTSQSNTDDTNTTSEIQTPPDDGVDTIEPAEQAPTKEGIVPEPPDTLTVVCSDATNEELVELCREECAVASCCTITDPSLNCFFSNEATCAKYVACEILLQIDSSFTTSTSLSAAPSDLALVCTNIMDPEYRDTCEDLCKPSECCSSSCSDDPNCAGYAPCDILHPTSTTTSSIPAARDDIAQICTEDNIENFRSDCEDSCRPAYCCWTLTEGENCREDNVEACDSYEPCKTLSLVPPDAPDDLADICSMDSIAKDTDNINLTVIEGVPWLDESSDLNLTCTDVCEKILCCLGSELNNGLVCPNYTNGRCLDYSFCSVLDPVYDILSVPVPGSSASILQDKPDELVSACSSKLTQQGQDDGGTCEAACEPAKCCIEGTGVDYCFDDNRDACNAYGICFVLPEVASACSHDNLASTEGQLQCENLCADHSCCFEPGADGESCWYDEWDECVKYAPCFSLLGINNGKITPEDDGDAPPPEVAGITVADKPPDLNEKCAGILKGASASAECIADCALAECCVVEGEGDCFDSNVQTCSSYGICFVLPEVASSCSHTSIENDAGHEACYNLCYPHSCCFTSGPDNCYNTHQKECMKYAACFTLLAFHGGTLPTPEEFTLGESGNGDTSSSPEPTSSSTSSGSTSASNNGAIPDTTPAHVSSGTPTADHPDVEDVCNLYSPSFNEALCQQDCSIASCCVLEGDDNCYDEHEDACLSFSPCFTDPAVSVSCHGNQLSSLESRSECLEVCTPYACCFELTDSGDTTCPPEKERQCIKFLRCAVVASLLIENP